MKPHKLHLRAETLRLLTAAELDRAAGGRMGTNDGQSCTVASDGGNCQSELSDCPTHVGSCINVSCTFKDDPVTL